MKPSAGRSAAKRGVSCIIRCPLLDPSSHSDAGSGLAPRQYQVLDDELPELPSAEGESAAAAAAAARSAEEAEDEAPEERTTLQDTLEATRYQPLSDVSLVADQRGKRRKRRKGAGKAQVHLALSRGNCGCRRCASCSRLSPCRRTMTTWTTLSRSRARRI